jgi:alkanesulfonate monooxygenase SsuD/methylene tetrahydromethanopterin reductase-like flavin-dependent oxidoreductase (luciferase family)
MVAEWRAAIATAEREGFGSVWVTGTACDPCVLAGGVVPLAASLTLGVVSGIGAGDRNPSVLARDVTTLDVLSSGRSAVLLQLDAGEAPGKVVGMGEWGRLLEAAAVCRLLFTEEAPVYAGQHFTLAGAANRPRPVRPGGPPVLVQVPTGVVGLIGGREATGDGGAAPGPLDALVAVADAWVVTGGPAEVASFRKVLDGCSPSSRSSRAASSRVALLWRGELPSGDGALKDATAVHEAGADGIIVRIGAAGEAPTAQSVAATARALAPVVMEWVG